MLGFKLETFGPQQRVALKFGQQKFNLRPVGDADWGTCPVDAPGCLDMCFMTQGPIAAVVEHLLACGVAIAHGPSPRRALWA